MSSSDPRAPGRPGRRAGFTLTEMMVALVMAGVLTTALYELVRTQARFAAVESQRQDAQANGRAALDVIAGDLRAALPQGLIQAGEGELVMALPRAWGVLCADNTATAMTAAFPAMGPDAFAVLAHEGTGVMVNTSATSTPEWAPRPALDGTRAAVTAAAPVSAAAECPSAAGTVAAYRLAGSRFPLARAGTLVAVYQLVRYDVGQSEGKWWMRRSNGLSGPNAFSMVPLAGPVAARDSAGFGFYAGAAADPVPGAPGGDTAALGALSRIRLRVVTVSSGAYGGTRAVSRDSATILLRNRVRPLACAVAGPAPC